MNNDDVDDSRERNSSTPPLVVQIPPNIASDDDANTTLETTKKEFRNWQSDGQIKRILCDLFHTGDKSIGCAKYPVGDQSTWNVFNIRANRSDEFPARAPSEGMRVKAKNWLLLFRSYAMECMKIKVKSAYLLLFNSEEYRHLRGERTDIVNFKQMVEILENNTDEQVWYWCSSLIVFCFLSFEFKLPVIFIVIHE